MTSTNDDSDDAPEDLSLSEGKKLTLERRSKEVDAIRSAKMEKKRKIQRKQVNQQAKKKKLMHVMEKLPDTILNQLSDQELEHDNYDPFEESNKHRHKNDIDRHLKKSVKKVKIPKAKDDVPRNEKSDVEDNVNQQESNFEIRKCQLKPVVINKQLSKQKHMNQSAKDFLSNHFYGDRIQRVPSASLSFKNDWKYPKPSHIFSV